MQLAEYGKADSEPRKRHLAAVRTAQSSLDHLLGFYRRADAHEPRRQNVDTALRVYVAMLAMADELGVVDGRDDDGLRAAAGGVKRDTWRRACDLLSALGLLDYEPGVNRNKRPVYRVSGVPFADVAGETSKANPNHTPKPQTSRNGTPRVVDVPKRVATSTTPSLEAGFANERPAGRRATTSTSSTAKRAKPGVDKRPPTVVGEDEGWRSCDRPEGCDDQAQWNRFLAHMGRYPVPSRGLGDPRITFLTWCKYIDRPGYGEAFAEALEALAGEYDWRSRAGFLVNHHWPKCKLAPPSKWMASGRWMDLAPNELLAAVARADDDVPFEEVAPVNS